MIHSTYMRIMNDYDFITQSHNHLIRFFHNSFKNVVHGQSQLSSIIKQIFLAMLHANGKKTLFCHHNQSFKKKIFILLC